MAQQICILTAFSELPQKDLIYRCCLIHLKKQLHLPTLFVKHCNIFCADIKCIGNIYKRALEFFGVVYNSAKSSKVFLFGLIPGKFDSLIADNPVNTLDKVFTINDLILKPAFLTDDKVRTNDIDFIQSVQIKVPSVEDVVGIGFVGDIIHRLSIVNIGIGDIDVCRNLRNDIKKSMSLDPTFCTAELSPPEKAEAEVNCRRIKGFLWQKLDKLCKYIRSSVHIALRISLGAIYEIKCRCWFCRCILLNIK